MIEDYPPLATLEERPLHDARPAAEWYACRFPERPRDGRTTYDWRCHGCIRHAEASLVIQGDVTQYWQYKGSEPHQTTTLGWLVARSKTLLGMP